MAAREWDVGSSRVETPKAPISIQIRLLTKDSACYGPFQRPKSSARVSQNADVLAQADQPNRELKPVPEEARPRLILLLSSTEAV
jgi:hypothetical protein